ncbi:MAG TPA: carboxypeptidase regulatory-like domain-containing protein [Bryobacteraceae bacterium]|jgi:hypothetical protein|nr:carboxypeptidase regulatory-like domain-containing protein [Bryobacteraceae bacterium]
MSAARFPRATFSCVVFLCFAARSDAQNLYGTLTGNVTDSTAAAIPGAKVEALNTETGFSRAVSSDERGVYIFSDLQTGAYKITIRSGAFTPFIRTGIPVVAGNVRRLDAVLQVAQITESVVVDAAAIVLQTDRGDVNAQISKEEISDLPIDGGRNYQSLYKLLPGFTPPEELHSDAGNPQRAMGTNVNGASYSNNNTRIDGATVSYPWLPHIVAYVPPADAIQTVNVVTNSFDAEQGMAGGAAMNVTIKSGTNQFHGSAWEYHTNSALKARNYFYCLYSCPGGDPNRPAKNIQNQPGATLGGPIKKNKLFFFASWETTKRRVNASGLQSIPTEPLKRGDFSPYNANIYDPQTGNPDGSGRTLFPDKLIPATRIDPAAATMAGLLPDSETSGVSSNYFATGGYKFNRYNADFKVNYNPSSKTTLFARYGFSPSDIYDPPMFGKAGGGALNGGQPGHALGLIQNASAGGTYMVSPSILVDANMGFTRLRLSGENDDLGQNFGLDVLKIPGTNGSYRLQGGIPRFTVSNFTGFGNTNVSNPFLFRDNQYTGLTSLSWMKGAHSIRFGAEYTYYTINHFQPQLKYGPRGGFNFTGGNTTLRGATPSTYNNWADFLLGLPADMGKDIQYVNPSAVRMPSYGVYIRDQWQMNRKLTVSYGTRWEYYPFATREHRGGERYDPVLDKVLIGGVGGVPTSTGVDVGHGQFAPRLGIAYRVSNKTVLRGGFGITIDPNSFRHLRDAYPAVISLQITQPDTYHAAGTLRAGLPPVVGPDLSQATLPLPKDVGDTTFPRKYDRGYIKSFNVTLQRELPWGFVGQVAYVGSRAIRQTALININASDSAGTGQAGRLLFKQYGRTADIKMMLPFEPATYDSMQSRLTRRMGKGTMGVSFTFSKSVNYADNSDSGPSWNGPSMYYRNKAQAGFNRPKTLTIHFVQPVPLGRGHRFANTGVLAKITGGWQVNGIFSALQGRPFTVASSATTVNTVGNAQTADQVKEFVEFYGNIGRGERYFDPNAFVPPSGVRFGTAGRNILFGPGSRNLDGSLFRSIRVKEKVNLQFRWEVFNVTNTPVFGQPGATASSATRNADGTVRSTGGFTEITSASATERRVRFALKILF